MISCKAARMGALPVRGWEVLTREEEEVPDWDRGTQTACMRAWSAPPSGTIAAAVDGYPPTIWTTPAFLHCNVKKGCRGGQRRPLSGGSSFSTRHRLESDP